MPNPALIMLGGARHATSVFNVARSAGYEVAHIVDPGKRGTRLYDIEIIGTVEEIDTPERFHFCIAVGDNHRREIVHEDLRRWLPAAIFPVLIHASAVVSCGTSLGEGTVVMPGAIIGPNTTVGRFCILNTRCSIDHDGRMHDYSSLAPGVTGGGCVRIGARSAICIGATIKDDVEVGNDSVVGANSYLSRDLPEHKVAYGTPAKVVRSRASDEPYLK
jgi:sugar O-acyltransferase (sialic acid O-acetyltransferase NeuD family)